jgi:hypothetical protein
MDAVGFFSEEKKTYVKEAAVVEWLVVIGWLLNLYFLYREDFQPSV